MRISMLRIAVLTALVAALIIPAGALSAEMKSSVLHDGRYDISFTVLDVGDEEFTIRRSANGFEITARLEPAPGDQPDCESTYTLDENRSIRSATYRQLNGDAVEAEYTVRDGAIEAIARRDGQIIGEQTVSIDGPVTLTGPHYVTDFFVLHPRDLDVGERQTFTAHAFGFADWRLVEVTIECRRERDRTIRNEHGDKVSTRVYRCEIKTESMSFKTRSWLDDQGIPLKITIDKFPGDVQIRLKPLENAEN